MAIRHRIQRALLAWLEDARRASSDRFSCGDAPTVFAFDVGARVYGWLTRHELTVAADDGEVFWALLISYDAYLI